MSARLEALRREYTPWLSLVEIALEAAADARWDAAAAAMDPSVEGVLGHADPYLAARLRDAVGAVEPTPALRAALEELAALPLLQACRRRFAARCAGWSRGHCPICGAWPALAELRGLARERHLRCGRCGADWALAPLVCPFCDNDDHETQRSLVPEAGGESRRIEACDRCQGYVKTLAQLRAIPPAEVVLEDLASVDLDLAALERGYRRPEPRPGQARVELA